MIKKFLALLVFCAVFFSANAQSEMRKFDYKIGMGPKFIGFGDNILLSLENELTYKINHYFSASAFINFARGGEVDIENIGLFEGNSSSFLSGFNIALSPFKNNKINNFKVGTGIGWFRATHSYINFTNVSEGKYAYFVEEDKGVGFNVVIEDEYKIYDRYLVGVKLFLNGERYGANAFGALLRFGVIL